MVTDAAARVRFEWMLAEWCRPDPDPDRLTASLGEWSRSGNGASLVAAIRAEGVAPLCGYQIKRFHLDRLAHGDEGRGEERSISPRLSECEALADELVGDYYRNTAKNLWRLTRLRPLLASFDRARAPVLLLKGASLALSVYPEVGLREMSDVDLLIRPEQLEAADARLREAGYHAIDLAAIDLARPPREHLTTLDYRDPQGVKPAIHLHWHLINSTVPHADYSRRIDVDGIWTRAGRTSLDGLSVMELSPGDAVLYLSEHAMRVSHSMSRLIWMADLAWLIHRKGGQVAWDSVERMAGQWGIGRLVAPPLKFVRHHFDAPIPDHVLSALRAGAPSVGERFFARCLSRSIRRPGLSYLVHLALRRGFRAKARFIHQTLCPPRSALTRHFSLSQEQVTGWHYLSRLVEAATPALSAFARPRLLPHRDKTTDRKKSAIL